MHRIFGIQTDQPQFHRPGAYLIPERDGEIAVARVGDRHYLLGGGLEGEESQQDCIRRECLEEVGHTCTVEGFLCSAEWFTKDSVGNDAHYTQYYYYGTLTEQAAEPTEPDHELVWIPIGELQSKLHLEMQRWALKQYQETIK